MRFRGLRLALIAGLLACAVTSTVARGEGPVVGWGPPVYVDRTLAGGEPLVIADARHGTLVYTAHEGTTHLYRPGLLTPSTLTDFIAAYRNQVNIWVSTDDGKTWKRDDFGAGFFTDPTRNTGFSDPDFTMDEGGRIYDTGIDLANDALFSSQDGGFTWDKGTAQCHDGDRPWLAGGVADEVFMATDTEENQVSHQIFRSTDGGNTCSSTGAPDAGNLPDGRSYTGFGKLLYDRASRRIAEPIVICPAGGCGDTIGVGVSTASANDLKFTPTPVANERMFAHWPSLTEDAAGTLYLVWDTDPRATGTSGGCGSSGTYQAQTPLANAIHMAYSKDFGKTWSAPFAVAAPASARVLWPWVAAGDAGKVSVVWYQTDHVVDPDCQTSKVSIQEAQIFGADTPSPQETITDPVGQPIQVGGVCQGGTDCVASGKDRRLGDFFTNALDSDGCVMIASGDDRLTDPLTGGPLATSRPLFIRQNAGPSLIGEHDCGNSTGASQSTATVGVVKPCVPSIGFRSVAAHPAGRRVRFAVARRRPLPFHVEIFQTSHGRRLLPNRLVARFRGLSGSFTWNGHGRRATDGVYFARFVMRLPHRKPDIRRVTLQRIHGRFVTRPAFYGIDSCRTLGSFKLFEPVFGGPRNRPLGIAFRLTRLGKVSLVVRHGRHVVASFPAQDRRPAITYRLSVAARRLGRGAYSVTAVATRGGVRQRRVLVSRRL